MMKIFKATLLSFFLFFSAQANAGFLLEPFLGYESGKIDVDYDASIPVTDVDWDATGAELGLRLGWTFAGLQLGAEYHSAALLGTPTGSTIDSGVATTNMGVFVGFEFPVMFRIYGTYLLKIEDASDDISGSYPKPEGTGYKIGFGFTSLPIVDINIIYAMRNLEVEDTAGTKVADVGTTSYGLEISFPFEF